MKYLAVFALLALLLTACSKPVEQPPVNETNSTFINTGYHEITIRNFVYEPKSLTIYQGDRVKWINQMPFVKSIWIWGEAPSVDIRPGASWSYVFLDAGFFKIRDQYAQDMEGNITVLPYEERPDIKAKLEQELGE